MGSLRLVLTRAIFLDGKPVGYVYIRSDLTEIDKRLKRYGAIALVVLLLSLGAGLIVSALFRRAVALPIVQLADVARKVSQQKNYSVRATPSNERDEVALLVEAFNEMLAQIESRDDELLKAHDELETRVADRTRELVVANHELEAFSYSVSHDLRGPVDATEWIHVCVAEGVWGEVRSQREGVGRTHQEFGTANDAADRRPAESFAGIEPGNGARTGGFERDGAVDRGGIVPQPAGAESGLCYRRRWNGGWDPRLLTIVMENLLRNSWKYTSLHATAKIEFGSKARDGKTIYYVRDDGAGFDPRSAERLFQPFQRLHPAAEFPGNGIGLATVQRIIRRHGGEIWAEGQVDHGATFYFSLEPARLAAR